MCGQNLREEVGGSNFVGFSARPGRLETARFPGCLTSESEERETWTAESLRAASSTGEGVERCHPWKKSGRIRDFGGRRFRSSLMAVSASNRRSGQIVGPRQNVRS